MWLSLFRKEGREQRGGEREEAAFLRRELAAAYSLFNEVTDPLLVDQAVHRLLAAERGYDHLISRLRHRPSAGGGLVAGDGL